MDEWKEDEFGKRYRDVEQGGFRIREYETVVVTTNGTVYQSELTEHNRRMKQQDEEQHRAEKAVIKPLKICPFSDPGGDIKRCAEDRCAFYVDDSCGAFRVWEDHKTLGLQCPMLCRQLCRRDCAFSVNDGCTLLME